MNDIIKKHKHVVRETEDGLASEKRELSSNAHKSKRVYEKLSMSPVSVDMEGFILTGSCVNDSTVTSLGQEVNPVYGMSGETDTNTGKTFNFEWDKN